MSAAPRLSVSAYDSVLRWNCSQGSCDLSVTFSPGQALPDILRNRCYRHGVHSTSLTPAQHCIFLPLVLSSPEAHFRSIELPQRLRLQDAYQHLNLVSTGSAFPLRRLTCTGAYPCPSSPAQPPLPALGTERLKVPVPERVARTSSIANVKRLSCLPPESAGQLSRHCRDSPTRAGLSALAR